MLTNSVQIEGVKTGRGNITVRLSEQGYENIPLASVDINVSRPLELEPKNAAIQKAVVRVEKAWAAEKAKEKKLYAGMFG